MDIIKGYVINTIDSRCVEQVIADMKQYCEKEGTTQYKNLLEQEIAMLVDDIVLGSVPRPEGVTIFEAAADMLNRKIAYATSRNVPTKYNLTISAHVLYDFEGGKTYIRINTTNTRYEKALHKVKALQPCFVASRLPGEAKSENEKAWENLMGIYSKAYTPLGANLFPNGPVDIKPEDLSFPHPSERAASRASHTLENRYLGYISCEQQIQNYQLMPFMEEVLSMMLTTEAEEELRMLRTQLSTTLPVITTEIIVGSEGKKEG